MNKAHISRISPLAIFPALQNSELCRLWPETEKENFHAQIDNICITI